MPLATEEDEPMPDAKPLYLNTERIAAAREALGWSLDEAGARAGFEGKRPGGRWNQIEKGHIADPQISTLYRIARALGLELTEILVDPPRAAKKKC
jgi:transcriptional regulator with XRE-family HTH domain